MGLLKFRDMLGRPPQATLEMARLTIVDNEQGLPTQGRRQLKKIAHGKGTTTVNVNGNEGDTVGRNRNRTRIATLNVGTLTGRSREIAAALSRRNIDICAVQETRWSGSKSKDIGDGYKVLYHGSPRTKNGVGVIVSEKYRDTVAEVHRYDDRLMKIVFLVEGQMIDFFAAYAPQTGCTTAVRDNFWMLLEDRVTAVNNEHMIIIAGDLNGHVGAEKIGHASHGGFGYGQANTEGIRILDFADAHALTVVNTCYKKRTSHLASFYSGNAVSQIDYILVRQRDRRVVQDAKIIPYETVAPQHRPLVVTMQFAPPKRLRRERTGIARVKWWRWKEKAPDVIGRIKLPKIDDVESTWQLAAREITEAARAELGKTKPGRCNIDKMTWMWTADVQNKVQRKKRCFHEYRADKSPAKLATYKDAKREAKRAVAAAKAEHYNSLYEKLDTRDGERDLFRLVKSRHRCTGDIGKFGGINDENGKLIADNIKVAERWRQYFSKISTKEFPHPPIPKGTPVHGCVLKISAAEVSVALRAMRPGKASGPDEIAAEVWMSPLWSPTEWLAQFFNRMIAEGKVPAEWSRSTTVPIWKKKGSPADCGNYRPIRLLSHTMKIFERIIDRRLRGIVDLSKNQCGFVRNCGTIDAIHSVRLLVEKHAEKLKPLHFAFLDLEKAFDRVPHELIWLALRQHGVPEELVVWVKMLYRNVRSNVRTVAGTSTEFDITVGVHQGSALSPLLFILVMDTVTRDVQMEVPWILLYADDVMIASVDKQNLQNQVQKWKDRLEQYGLRLNTKKTEYLTTDIQETGTIQVDGQDLPRTKAFRYLGSVISDDGNINNEVTARCQAAWNKWRTTTGVMCDRRIGDRLKSKIYRTVVRPVALYGSECWAVTKEVERRMSVMETRMLRWTSGHTLLDHVPNDEIRARYKVAPITTKMRQHRLRWFGHVTRADQGTVAKTSSDLNVHGSRPRGRPRQRWWDAIHNDLKWAGLHPDQVHDRNKWRTRSKKDDPE